MAAVFLQHRAQPLRCPLSVQDGHQCAPAVDQSPCYPGGIRGKCRISRKYHRPGNSLIITNDKLAGWIRQDYPEYRLEASVIKNINNLKKVNEVFKMYDTVILPMDSNDDEVFLKSIDNKKNITLFANAGCAYTCPSKICYPSISKANKTDDRSLFQCSQKLKERNTIGMYDFDLDYLQSLGFERFKLLRPRQGNMTGF